jgi:hypothetical protein
LTKAGIPWRAISASSVVTVTSWRASQATWPKPGTPAASAAKSGESDETVGCRRETCIWRARRARAERRLDQHDVARQGAPQEAGEGRLRLDGDDARPGGAQRPRPVADMGADVEGQIARGE